MKLLLLTGGSKGLGRSLLKKFTGQDFTVIEFSRSGKTKHNIKCDLSYPEKFSEIFNRIISDCSMNNYAEIILINNAGTIEPIGPITNYETDDWIKHININLMTSIVTSGIFTKTFQNHPCKKTIVFISSGAAVRSKYGWSLYCASKAGIEQFCKTLAIEQAQQQYPVNNIIIDPGLIDTDMQADIRNTNENFFPEISRFTGFKENGLLKSPEYVADKIFNVISGIIKNGEKYIIE
jgi:benzil reductase ((S)-benzoin forming)